MQGGGEPNSHGAPMIGHYILDRTLGVGAFGKVKRRDTSSGTSLLSGEARIYGKRGRHKDHEQEKDEDVSDEHENQEGN